jgi:hypothetical protein
MIEIKDYYPDGVRGSFDMDIHENYCVSFLSIGECLHK